jgi:hypothetical protein
LGWLVRRMAKGSVVRAGWVKDRFVAELALHPAATAVKVIVHPDAELSVSGDTSSVGPGYHADVIARIDPILDELDYVWTEPFDFGATQHAMCAWLAGELGNSSQVKLGEMRAFVVEAPVLTMLGPRDAAWRDAVLVDPMRAADAFAWWQQGPGQAARSRALLAMWHEVPWREPLDHQERELMTGVAADLRAAHAADPALELPWAEWSQLLDDLGDDDDAVRERGRDHVPAIGYRRYDIEVEISGGWIMRLGGAFVGAWEDDGERYWATNGDRAVELTTLTANDETDSQRLLDVAPERHPVIERITEGDYRGRAEAYDEDDVHIVHGLVTRAPHVAIITCKGTAADEAWALATWRSLRQR